MMIVNLPSPSNIPCVCVWWPVVECFRSADGRGRDYRGELSYTTDGVSCQRWSRQYPHSHSYVTGDPDVDHLEGLGDHNHCRNPEERRRRPWCFTLQTASRWQYCDVPICSQWRNRRHGRIYALKSGGFRRQPTLAYAPCFCITLSQNYNGLWWRTVAPLEKCSLREKRILGKCCLWLLPSSPWPWIGLDWARFNVPLDTFYAISETVLWPWPWPWKYHRCQMDQATSNCN